MDIFQAIYERRSYRSYLDQPVEDEKLQNNWGSNPQLFCSLNYIKLDF